MCGRMGSGTSEFSLREALPQKDEFFEASEIVDLHGQLYQVQNCVFLSDLSTARQSCSTSCVIG